MVREDARDPLQPPFEIGFPHGHDQWTSAAGTNWATMALAHAMKRVVTAPACRRSARGPDPAALPNCRRNCGTVK